MALIMPKLSLLKIYFVIFDFVQRVVLKRNHRLNLKVRHHHCFELYCIYSVDFLELPYYIPIIALYSFNLLFSSQMQKNQTITSMSDDFCFKTAAA